MNLEISLTNRLTHYALILDLRLAMEKMGTECPSLVS